MSDMVSKVLHLMNLPHEVLQCIFIHCDTTTFLQLILACHELFDLASISRSVLLHHLFLVPGPSYHIQRAKGSKDHKPISFDLTSTDKIFLTLRQRASDLLYGAALTANCRTLIVPPSYGLQIDLRTADLGHNPDELDLYFAFRDRPDVHFYTWGFKQRHPILNPFADGDARVVLIARRPMLLSILYAWTPTSMNDYAESSHDPQGDSISASPTTRSNLRRNTTRQLLSLDHHSKQEESGDEEDEENANTPKPESKHPQVQYHVFHYSLYDRDRAVFQTVPNQDGLVPVHMSIKNGRSFSILWDSPQRRLTPSADARILVYKPDPSKNDHRQTVISYLAFHWRDWSERDESRESRRHSVDNELRKPRAIAHAVDDHYIKLYAAGGLVPYAFFYSGRQAVTSVLDYNHQIIGKRRYMIEQPFKGQHKTLEDGSELCCKKFLSLAVLHHGDLQIQVQGGVSLWIVRYENYQGQHHCSHKIDLDCLPWDGDGKFETVARLGGWIHGKIHTNLTGLDTVKVSKKGTRIAIAQWDKVLIWALRPACLLHFDKKDDSQLSESINSRSREHGSLFDMGEDTDPGSASHPDHSSDDSESQTSEDDRTDDGNNDAIEDSNAGAAQPNGTTDANAPVNPTNPIDQLLTDLNTAANSNSTTANTSDPTLSADAEDESTSQKPKKPSHNKWGCYAGQIVKDVFDEGSYVELQPIVLDLGGAVARKILFTSRRCVDDESEESSDGENESDGQHLHIDAAATRDMEEQDDGWETTDSVDVLGENDELPHQLDRSANDSHTHLHGLQTVEGDSAVQEGVDIEELFPSVRHFQSTAGQTAELSQHNSILNPNYTDYIVSSTTLTPMPHMSSEAPQPSTLITPTNDSITIATDIIRNPSTSRPTSSATVDSDDGTSTQSLSTTNPLTNSSSPPPTTSTSSPNSNNTVTSSTSSTNPSRPQPKSKGKQKQPPSLLSQSHTKTASHTQSRSEAPKRKRGHPRTSEDELIILTDRGVQIWHLGPRATRKRTVEALDLSRLEEGF